MTNNHTTSASLYLRRRVHAVLGLSLLASVAANISAAEPTMTGRAVAAWPPIALLLVVDVLGRAPRSDGWLGRIVTAATGLVATVAGIASFSHMREVALTAGESPAVAVLFPLTVDGLAVVCSAALVELNRRQQQEQQTSVSSVEPSDDLGGPGLRVQRSMTDPAPRVLVPMSATAHLNGHTTQKGIEQ